MKKTSQMELDIHPDQHKLDEEWVNQPQLRFRYGAELADARKRLTEAKAAMTITEAELEMAIRESPEKFDLPKVTEAAVKATVLIQEEYQACRQLVINTQHDVDIIEAAVTAIDHRKHALQDLVSLYLSGYFSNPKAPEGAREQMDQVVKASVRGRGRRRPDDWEDEEEGND